MHWLCKKLTCNLSIIDKFDLHTKMINPNWKLAQAD